MSGTTIAEIRDVRAEACLVEVETGVVSGLFQPLAELEVVRLVRAADGEEEYAVVRCLPGEVRTDILGGWSRSRRVAISAEAGDTEAYLFCGCPERIEWQFDASGRSRKEQILLRIEGLGESLRKMADLAVFGRYCRTRGSYGGQESNDTVELVDGLECIFNPEGTFNCSPEPIPVRLGDGSETEIHVFTHDDDADGEPWTVSRALRYLAWFYLHKSLWLDVSAILLETQLSATFDEGGRDYLASSAPLEWSLREQLESLSVESTNAMDAVSLLLRRAGIHWHIDPVGQAGKVRCEFRIWSEGEGPARCFTLDGSQRADLAGRGNEGRSEAVSCRIARNIDAGPRTAILLGDVKYHEVTLPLMPGWARFAEIDDVPESERSSRKAEALLPEDVQALGEAVQENNWFRRFHRKGEAFGVYQEMGRKWVLNEHGRYLAPWYNRYAPFDNYEPFDFSSVLAEEVAEGSRWTVRPRRLLDPITAGTEGQPFPIIVEISFDGGETWHTYTGPMRVLKDECAVVFDVDNLCEIAPPGVSPREQNLWYALIDQQARVRVTATIEGDERIVSRAHLGPDAAFLPGTVLDVGRELKFRSAAGATNALRELGLSGDDVDDRARAARMAQQALRAAQEYEFEVRLPGIRLDAALGQRVWGITRPGARLYRRTVTGALPSVRRIEYVNEESQFTRVIGS